MKINLIRLASSLDPKKPYLKDSEEFINELNNELFEYDLELVENEVEAEFSIVFIETGGSEQIFIKKYKNIPEPYILLSDGVNNSLPATLEIRTFLEQKKKKHIFLFGDSKELASKINNLASFFSCKKQMDNASLGVIGAPSDWLIASKVDYKKAKEKFNVNLIDISSDELKEEINKGLLEDIPHIKEFKKLAKDEKVLTGALEIYSGLKRIIAKYKLKGFTLRCFDLIGEYKNTACLAFAMLNEEGIVAACEGDVPTLLTMFFIKCATRLSSFQANPSKIFMKDETILFSHCTVPINMCEKYEFMTHFESDLGIGIKGKLREQDVTIIKFTPELDHTLFAIGKISENLSLPNYCRTQIKIKLDEESLYAFLNIPFGNHVVIVYGNLLNTLFPLLDLYHCL